MVIVSPSVMTFVVCFPNCLAHIANNTDPDQIIFLRAVWSGFILLASMNKGWNALEFMQQTYKAGNIFRWKYFSTLLFINVVLSEYHLNINKFGSRLCPTFCWATSGSKLFAKCTSRQQNLSCSQRANVKRQSQETEDGSFYPGESLGAFEEGMFSLFQPARGEWSEMEPVTLKAGQVSISWPPPGWKDLSRDVKLLQW